MTRYADPERCPDCLGTMQYGATSCPTCGLSLEGPVAQRLFETLAYADELLIMLRGHEAAAAAPTAAVPVAPASDIASAPAPVPVAVAAPAPVPRARMSGASVPKILLGLGAVCLLVAALVFLAVTWSVMGVAARTATLVGFTVIAGVLARWVARRGLRAAAEALALVALGLVTLDVFGAEDSGWLGDLEPETFTILLGVVLVAAGSAAALAARRTPVGQLVGTELVAAAGVAVTIIGTLESDWLPTSPGLLLATLLAGAATAAAWHLRLITLAVGAALAAGAAWLGLLGQSAERALLNDSVRELWLELEGWPLLAASLTIGAVALVRPLPVELRVLATALSLLVLGFTALVPVGDEGTDALTLGLVAVLVAASVLARVSEEPWSWAPAVTMVVTGAWVLSVTLELAGQSTERLLDAGAQLWTANTGERLPQLYGEPSGWLLPLCTVALLGAAVVLAHAVRLVDRALAPLAEPSLGAAVVVAALLLTLALYPAPLWLVVGLLLVSAAAFVCWALLTEDLVALAGGGVLLLAGVAPALADEWLTAPALLVGAGLGLAGFLRASRTELRAVGGTVLAVFLAGSVWTWGELAGADRSWTALVAMLVLGALLVGFHRLRSTDPVAMVGLEVGALAGAFTVALAGVAAAPYTSDLTWTAVYLTVAGAMVSAISLLRADRRILGWPGGLLLAMATWVRLWEVGVETPEAYTLPPAFALLVVGVVHLRRSPGADTITALSPALGLGLTPSLLWVLWDPLTLRSVLLGLACLALVVVGLRLRWTAPVVFAATVGLLLVLRHAAPYAEAVPRWVLIGSAGALLVTMGITWERRLQEARSVVGYMRALR